MVMEIVAFDEDTKEDGTKAAITWLSKDIAVKHVVNTTTSLDVYANMWPWTTLRSWLRGDFYNTLPAEVTNIIVPVNKTYYDSGSKVTRTFVDTVWIPSYRELFGGTSYESSGADYTEYFSSNAARVKSYNGSNDSWWLRSSYTTNKFCAVFGGGYSNSYTVTENVGVVPGFCT